MDKLARNEKGVLHFLPLVIVAVVGLIAFLLIAQTGPFKNNLLSSIFTKKASFAANLPVPANLKVQQDDKNVILDWDNYYTTWDGKPNGVTGYVVNWGEYNQLTSSINNPQKKLSDARVVQLQPLTEGVKYAATVQSVDTLGNTSAPSAIITFQSDSSRVNTLRNQMNGFFDDFNLPAGAFDERKWNGAYSNNVGGMDVTGQFINNQYHAHNQTFDRYGDRGQNSSRPRAVFDFTPGPQRPNGETEYGTITFDMDGGFGRDTWYLDILDIKNGLIDIPNRASVSESPDEPPQAPFNNIRLRASNNFPDIFYIDGTGKLFNTVKTPNTAAINTCCDRMLQGVPNIRNKWVIKVSPSRIIVTINGKLAADVNGWKDASGATQPLNLSFSKAYLLWVQFSYNTGKAGFSSSLLHWDNFGFDAPVGATQNTITHNYNNGVLSTPIDGGCRVGNGPPGVLCRNGSTTIKIPDSVAGSTAQRVMFTVQGPVTFNTSDYIQLNGQKYMIPDVKTLPQIAPLGPGYRTADGSSPLQMVIPVTNAQTGDNKLELFSSGLEILNIHLEIDFPKASAPSYTQPADVWKYNPIPWTTGNGTSQIGNGAYIGSIVGINTAGTPAEYPACDYTCYGPFMLRLKSDGTHPQTVNPATPWVAVTSPTGTPYAPIPQKGNVGIRAIANGRVAVAGTGSYPGLQSIQLYVDHQKVVDKSTATSVPAPAIDTYLQWDTTKFCNGPHEVFVVGFSPTGVASTPDYFQLGSLVPGSYKSITVWTDNPGQTACPDARVSAYNETRVDRYPNAWYPGFSGGTVGSHNYISANGDDQIYGYPYVGNSSYTFKNLPNVPHEVTLKFVEHGWNVNLGQRVFNVSLNGSQVLSNFDIRKEVATFTPLDKKFTITPVNGQIALQLTGVTGLPTIDAAQAVPVGTTFSTLTFTATPPSTPAPTDDHNQTSPGPSSSPITTPSPTSSPSTKQGDLNNDNVVNAMDFAILLSKWGSTDSNADLNKDGSVGLVDFSILLSKWGT